MHHSVSDRISANFSWIEYTIVIYNVPGGTRIVCASLRYTRYCTDATVQMQRNTCLEGDHTDPENIVLHGAK